MNFDPDATQPMPRPHDWRPWAIVAIAVLALVGLLLPACSVAQPVLRAQLRDVVIELYAEPCRLQAVTNLKRRATWTEDGKVVEGCFAGIAALEVVMFYFEDRTVAVVPARMFDRVSDT